MTVVTYPGRRRLAQYTSLNHAGNNGGLEVLVSVDLARYVRDLHIYLDKFFMFGFLKAQLRLSNGLVMGGAIPATISTTSNQPWA